MTYKSHTLPLSTLTHRADLNAIAGLIPPSTKVLDLGCGDGILLQNLVRNKHVTGRGIEISEDGVLDCVRRGLSVRQGNLEEGLADYPDDSFDYVILSQTLPYLNNPIHMLSEMLRVGKLGVVSFANWGFWRSRLHLLVTGRFPPSPDLPQTWHDERRWQAFTIADFTDLCQEEGIIIREQVYLSGTKRIERAENLLASTAVFVLTNR